MNDNIQSDTEECQRLAALNKSETCPCCKQEFDGVMVVEGSVGRLESACLYRGYVILHDLPYEKDPDEHITAASCTYTVENGPLFHVGYKDE